MTTILGYCCLGFLLCAAVALPWMLWEIRRAPYMKEID